MVDDAVLEKHGTKAFQLPPTAVASAAQHDVTVRASLAEMHPDDRNAVRYAFVARHVRKAKSAKDLLALALKEISRGAESGKKNTRMLYGDPALLEAALKVVQHREAMG